MRQKLIYQKIKEETVEKSKKEIYYLSKENEKLII